jgi:cytoskeletal protein RodZ
MEIGAKLKEVREEKNISLDTLQETTKIQKRYLLAIEQGNLHLLPGKFYARAFIKEYATAVGLDPDELLEGHQDEVGTPEEVKDDLQYTRMQRSRQENRTSKSPAIFSIMPTIIVVLLVIGIILAGVYFYQKAMEKDTDQIEQRDPDEIIRNKDSANKSEDTNPTGTDAPVETDQDDENEEDAETDEIESELTLVESATGQRPESTFELNHTGEEVIITFEPTGTSWLDVTNDQGNSLLATNTEENQPIELDVSDESSIRLNIGNTTQLPVIKINDIQLEYPVDINQFVTQRIWININNASE